MYNIILVSDEQFSDSAIIHYKMLTMISSYHITIQRWYSVMIYVPYAVLPSL